jgi:tRNA threonylcarbamoyl adenosine modification protein (Sua5/YciO/YrdC/YwlC family)
MKSELVRIHPLNPQENKIRKVVDVLQNGGVVIYPTDTIYGLGCDIHNQKAVERVCKIKNINPAKINLSFICYDLSHIAEYTKNLPTAVFKVMKKALPGPFTFILPANSNVPRILHTKKNTVGIRIPDNKIARCLVKELGNPILSTSIKDEDDLLQYSTDPELIYEKYKNQVEAVIDGGFGNNIASTIIDCTDNEIQVIREGLGDITPFL